MIELRQASSEDAYRIASTRQIVWKEVYRGIYPDEKLDHYDVDFYTARDSVRMENPASRYYLFLAEGECIGYFSFGPYNYGTYKDFSLCLNDLYIRREFTGIGLGKRAFSVVRQHCLEIGISKFFCGCNANNTPAIAFYRHMGGIQGDDFRLDVPKEDQIIHFEFYIGD